jgi:hypothetical protein
MTAEAETPNPKTQAPKNFQTPISAKAEAPNPNFQALKNDQIPMMKRQPVALMMFGICSLGFVWTLGCGFWNF